MADRPDDERLSRLLDGELAPDATETIRRDRALDERATAMADGDRAVRDWFASHLADPPTALEHGVRTAFAVRRSRRRGFVHRWWLPAAAAVAVAVLGVAGFDRMIERRVGAALDQVRAERASDMALLASAMQEVLETRESGMEAKFSNHVTGFSVTLIARRTWRSGSGHWCREFVEIFDGSPARGAPVSTACRSPEGRWFRVRTELSSPDRPFIPDRSVERKL